GPMTLPCTGPIILSAFALGVGNVRELANGLAFFLAFGVGFGWPLVILPLVALPTQRRWVGWLTRHHVMLTRVSAILLIAIGAFGILTELLPDYLPIESIALAPEAWAIYWVVVAALTIAVSVYSYRRTENVSQSEPN